MELSDSLYVSLIFAGFAVSIAGFALLYEDTSELAEPAAIKAAPAYHYTVDGDKATISRDEFYTMCPVTDCVPSLAPGQATYVSSDEADAWLDATEPIISVTTSTGTAVAYPLAVMRHHFIVNTELDGQPVAVTYAPYAGTAAVFSRTIGADTPRFRFTGKLLHGTLVMRDDRTGTLWGQHNGQALMGELVPGTLQRVESHILPWRLWREQHPNATVLSRQTGVYPPSRYNDNPYFDYPTSPWLPMTDASWSGTDPKTPVYGLIIRNEAVAYRTAYVKGVNVVQDTVNGVPIMLVQNEETGVVNGFRRDVGGSTLNFHPLDRDRLVDQSGTVWNMDGEAVDGPANGTSLDELDVHQTYWFTWKLFYPDTRLAEP